MFIYNMIQYDMPSWWQPPRNWHVSPSKTFEFHVCWARVGIHHIASSIILMVLVLLTSSFEVSYRTLPPCDVQTFNILDRESAPLSKIYYYQWGFFVLLTLTALDAMYSHFQSAYKTITPIKMEALPLVWVAHWYKTPIWFRNHHLCLKGKHA